MSKKSNSNIGILGYGEVGQAIAKFYRTPRLRKRFGGQARIKDLNRDDGLNGTEILHVCIPWSKDFVKIVKNEIKKIKPKLTIIHSTISPGTTKKIGGMIVHSPIRGMHPNLYLGIKTFVKYIGTDHKMAGEIARRHFKNLGIRTKIFRPSIITEIGKLLDTSYYGLCIAWHGEMAKICNKFGVDFKKAVTDFNKTYNEGYIKLNKKNVVRPVLYPPKKHIGGRCIMLNAKILKKFYKSKALDSILKYEPRKK